MSDHLTKRIAYCCFLSLIWMFAALRPIGLDPDSAGYQDWILHGIYYQRAELSFILIVEFWKGFVALEYVPRLVLATFSLIHILILHLAIKNYSNSWGRAFLLFFLLLYSISLLTQIRIGVASAIFFWAIRDIAEKNTSRYFFKMGLAFSFHSMSLVFLPFYFINQNKINKYLFWCVLPVGFCFVFVLDRLKLFVIGSIVQYLPPLAALKIKSYLIIEEQSISLFNLWFIYVLLVYHFALYSLKSLPKECILYVKVLGVGIMLYFATNFMSILSIRILNSVGLLVLVIIPCMVNIYKPRYVTVSIFYGAAFLIFLNWHFRNQLLDLEILFL